MNELVRRLVNLVNTPDVKALDYVTILLLNSSAIRCDDVFSIDYEIESNVLTIDHYDLGKKAVAVFNLDYVVVVEYAV